MEIELKEETKDYKRIYVAKGICDSNNGFSKGSTPYIKIGDTKHLDVANRHTYLRDNSILDWEAIKNDGSRYRDYEFHKFIDENYSHILYRTEFKHTGREQYDFKVDSEIYKAFVRDCYTWHGDAIILIQELMNEIRIRFHSGIVDKRYDFPLRDEQQTCVKRVVQYAKENPSDKFLIAAKMRFGKTFTCYNICNKLGAKNVLILTYKPQAKSSWKSDLIQHVAFDGCGFYDYVDDSSPIMNSTNMNVFFVSFQSLLCADRLDDEKFSWMRDIEWDVVILDEIHYGSDTTKAKNILSSIKHKFELHLSGTPFKQMMLGNFGTENTFQWTYTNEQQAKYQESLELPKNYLVSKTMYQSLPQMKFFNVELDWSVPDLKLIKAQFSNDEMPTMTKLLSTKDNQFVNVGAVRMVIDVFLQKVLSCNEVHDSNSLNHIFMCVPGIDAGNVLCDFLKSHVGIKSLGYEIINACGAGEEVENKIDDVKNIISYTKKTITLSCGRFTEAVTVPQWGTVIMLNDCKSPSTYLQSIFRAQSPYVPKDESLYKRECYVVDFNINRMLSAIYYNVAISNDENEEKDLETRFREFLKCAPVYNFTCSSLVCNELKFEKIYQIAIESLTSINSFNGNSVQIPDSFENIPFDKLLKLDTAEFSNKINKILTKNKDIKPGKNFKTTVDSNVKKTINDKLSNTKIEKLLQIAKTIELSLPRYLEISNRTILCLNDLLISGDWDDEREFELVTQITRDEFKLLVNSGLYDRDALDDKIGYFISSQQLFDLEISRI